MMLAWVPAFAGMTMWIGPALKRLERGASRRTVIPRQPRRRASIVIDVAAVFAIAPFVG